MATPPSSILVIGSGIFGLTTALSLARRPTFASTSITVLDSHPFPVPDASSIDSSRVVRADYSDPLYASLAMRAQSIWRGDDGPNGPFKGELKSVYSESGIVLVCDESDSRGYLDKAISNVKHMLAEGQVRELPDRKAICEACGTGGMMGSRGYVNYAAGWADAEGGMKVLMRRCEESGRMRFVLGEAHRFVYEGGKVTGVGLRDGRVLRAELVIVAAGAWTPGLVDLGGRAVATGQVLGYVKITEDIEERLKRMPVILNFSSGLFVLPPRNGELKVARHGIGYLNTTTIHNASGKSTTTSIPKTTRTDLNLGIPEDGEEDLLRGLREVVPELKDRKFFKTRLCWYTDTPTANFIVDYHPDIPGLFIATGGSGHAYKFLPVLGEEIVDILEGKGEFKRKWAWPNEAITEVVTKDGSRGGVEQVELAGLKEKL